MPAWWGKKSTKNKERDSSNSPKSSSSNSIKASLVKNEKKRGGVGGRGGGGGEEGRIKDGRNFNNNRPKSFDEISVGFSSRNSPRKSHDFASGGGGGSTGFSGFDSSSSLDRVYPLPRPSISSNDQFHAGAVGLGSGSVSVSSSVSSSGFSEENSHVDQGQLIASRYRLTSFTSYTGPLSSLFDLLQSGTLELGVDLVSAGISV